MTFLIVPGLILGYLPGAVIFRVPLGRRELRAALRAEERAYWGIILSLALTLSVAFALAAAGRFSLNRVLVIDLIISLLPVLIYRRRLLYSKTATPATVGGAVIPAVLVAVGLWLYFPPSEYIIGGKDPGTYMNEGIQIAQRGSLAARDPVVASVPSQFRDLFFPQHPRRPYYGLRFMGFFIRDPASGEVVGQFPHLYPASIALGYGLNGLTGARWASSFWAILGLLSVYFAAARLFGRRVPQVLLLHGTAVGAAQWDRLFGWLAERGYRFATADEVLADPAFAEEHCFLGPRGPGLWVHPLGTWKSCGPA